MIRPGWDQTWLDVATTMARRSSCARRQIGAVIASPGNRIVATGYNGPPTGLDARCMTDCPRNLVSDPTIDYDNCISIHAEANALMFCDRRDRIGGRLYVTEMPCFGCAKLIANSGLQGVVVATLDNQEHRPIGVSVMLMQNSGLAVQVGPSG